MSIFSIADLHLSLSTNKPMDVFGSRWQDYTAKIEKNWRAIVNDDDFVIIPGDISWSMSIENAKADFVFIDSLPGKKILGKGNHDYWWESLTKMRNTLKSWNISTIDFLYNNAYATEDYIISGTRGWYLDEKQQNVPNETDYEKIILREVMRLDTSLKEAVKLKTSEEQQILVFLHFPPIFKSFICREIIEKLKEYKIKNCYFGHIHGNYSIPRTFEYENINFTLIAADFLNFIPMITMPLDY